MKHHESLRIVEPLSRQTLDDRINRINLYVENDCVFRVRRG